MIERVYGVTLNFDAAADADNTKCLMYYTKEDNPLEQCWKGFNIYLNPPFDLKESFLAKAKKERDENRVFSVLVLPSDTSVKWFRRWSGIADHKILVEGRVPFISEDPERPKSGNNKGTTLFIFNPKNTVINVKEFEFWNWRAEPKLEEADG